MPWLFEKRYQLDDEPLGKGGMGAVYAGVNVYSRKAVAVKLIARAGAERMQVRRFEREAMALAALEHPNIVKLLECGETEEHLYLVMERARGETLRTLIRRSVRAGKLLDVSSALYILERVARAMIAAHKLGIVHRDIKPDNVMVGEGGAVVVLDFGLALRLDANQQRVISTGMTHPGAVPGTPRYMAAEQILGRHVDGRTDVYAMGITLYETLSGRTPYDRWEDANSSTTELWAHHIHATPSDIREHVDCPPKVCEIVRRCIEKRPEDRYQTASELAVSLRDAMRDRPLAAERATRESIEMRPTEPQLMTRPQKGPEPEAHDAPRATAPMPADFVPVSALPFRGPAQPAGRGVGYTVRLQRPEIPPAMPVSDQHADPEPGRVAVLPTQSASTIDVRRSTPLAFIPSPPLKSKPPYYLAPVLGVAVGGVAAVALRLAYPHEPGGATTIEASSASAPVLASTSDAVVPASAPVPSTAAASAFASATPSPSADRAMASVAGAASGAPKVALPAASSSGRNPTRTPYAPATVKRARPPLVF